jgi:hypothetical protein
LGDMDSPSCSLIVFVRVGGMKRLVVAFELPLRMLRRGPKICRPPVINHYTLDRLQCYLSLLGTIRK